MAEDEKELTVRAELPGIDPKDLDVSVVDNHLVLSGEKKESSETKEKGVYHSETRYGSFRRTLPLPEGVDTEHVDAQYTNGVLTLASAEDGPRAAEEDRSESEVTTAYSAHGVCGILAGSFVSPGRAGVSPAFSEAGETPALRRSAFWVTVRICRRGFHWPGVHLRETARPYNGHLRSAWPTGLLPAIHGELANT